MTTSREERNTRAGKTNRQAERARLKKKAEKRLGKACHWKNGKLYCGENPVSGVAEVKKPEVLVSSVPERDDWSSRNSRW